MCRVIQIYFGFTTGSDLQCGLTHVGWARAIAQRGFLAAADAFRRAQRSQKFAGFAMVKVSHCSMNKHVHLSFKTSRSEIRTAARAKA